MGSVVSRAQGRRSAHHAAEASNPWVVVQDAVRRAHVHLCPDEVAQLVLRDWGHLRQVGVCCDGPVRVEARTWEEPAAGRISGIELCVDPHVLSIEAGDFECERDDVPALVNHLNLLLAGNALSQASQAEIIELVEGVPEDSGGDWRSTRAGLAVTLVMIDSDYLIQR